MKKITSILGICILGLASCNPTIRPEIPAAANLDFSNYVAVGNSLTAGYADGTLTSTGQASSYPAILSMQFAVVGGPTSFKQPLVPGSEGSFGIARRVLGNSFDCNGMGSLSPILSTNYTPNLAADAASVAGQGPFNNLGVPGIRAIDFMVPGYGLVNPYAARFFQNPLGRPVAELLVQQPSFFTMWLGNNDVLAYASSGGSGGLSGNGFDRNAISDVSLFAQAIDTVINSLTRNGAKGAVINIPDITDIPFFATVPSKGLLLNASQAQQLTAAYAGAGISFTEGANYFVIADPTSPAGIRKMKEGEYLLLTVPQDSIKCFGMGSQTPIPGRYVLDATEVANVKSATATFNQILADRAAAKGLAFVDIASYLKTLPKGIVFNGVTFNATFVSGGVYSLDGVHLAPRGYALTANYIIQAINGKYGSAIPKADVNNYNGVLFP